MSDSVNPMGGEEGDGEGGGHLRLCRRKRHSCDSARAWSSSLRNVFGVRKRASANSGLAFASSRMWTGTP